MKAAAALAFVLGLLASGCDEMVAYCNAGGYGTPQECQERWDPCGSYESACAAGDSSACQALQSCG